LAAGVDSVRKNATGDIQMLITDTGKYNVGLARRSVTGRPESPIVHTARSPKSAT
jgi:hypothetical protein